MKYARVIPRDEWNARMRRRVGGQPHRIAIRKLTIRDIEKYLSKVSRETSVECWRYNSKSNQNYPRFKGFLCHRVSYELYNGPIAFGLTIDHLCMNRWCQNPKHLEAVSAEENSRRYRSYQLGLV